MPWAKPPVSTAFIKGMLPTSGGNGGDCPLYFFVRSTAGRLPEAGGYLFFPSAITRKMNENTTTKRPGVCVPFEEAKAEWPEIKADEKLVRKIWEENDAEAYMFLWQCIVSF